MGVSARPTGPNIPLAWTPCGPRAAANRRISVSLRVNYFIGPKKSGAGEGIRTLDPNLGKVVLYP